MAHVGRPDPLLAELSDLEMRSWQAWQTRDASYFEGFLSDDHVEVGFGGVAGKAAVLATVRSRGCVVKSYSVTDLALHRLSADTALLTYHAAQDTVCGSVPVPSPVWVASLYVRRGGRWLNAVYQQSQETRP